MQPDTPTTLNPQNTRFNHNSQIVQAAEKSSNFDNLAGAEKPQIHPESPADAVLIRLMKEADAKSPVVVMRRQIFDGQAVLKGLTDPDASKVPNAILSRSANPSGNRN